MSEARAHDQSFHLVFPTTLAELFVLGFPIRFQTEMNKVKMYSQALVLHKNVQLF